MQATGLPYAFILQKGTLAATGGEAVPLTGTRGSARAERAPRTRFDPDQALRAIQASVAEPTALVATTGYTGRALYAAGDRPGQLYMVGSMGCALSLGLGIARVRPKLRVVVLDGDGALLMRMGAMATAGSVHPANLVHVLLDNGVHDSTGAQRTVAPFVDFGGIALASGYQSARLIEDLGELPGALAAKGPAFVHLPTLPRSDPKLPRPKDGPVAQARRFRAFVQGTQG
jgi:phosphonopyruvate decarboxylase